MTEFIGEELDWNVFQGTLSSILQENESQIFCWAKS